MKQVFMTRLGVALIFGIGVLVASMQPYPAQAQVKDYSFHPVLIYSFVRYIEWPEDKDVRDFDIGIYTSDRNVVLNFEKMAESKSSSSQRFTIHQFTNMDQMPKDLDLIFITENYNSSLEEITKRYAGGTLIVTEKANALDNGSCINFVTRRGRPYFEINTGEIRARNMQVSQRLLDLSINKR